MKIELKEITIRELVEDYDDKGLEGVVGYGGQLDIRPAYQREFIYNDKQRNAVIDTVMKNFPLNVMYWAVRENGGFEIIDGQQRTISICQYVKGRFSIAGKYFHSLFSQETESILDYKLMVYFCEGSDKDKLDWFETINIAGAELTKQELRNAVFSGSWVSDAKRYFSKTGCVAYSLGSDYLSGSSLRQDYLETAIKWISGANCDEDIRAYMSKHQHDPNAVELWNYFQKVIKWIKETFTDYESEMRGLEWGRLYETYHKNTYNPQQISAQAQTLYADPYVKKRKGIFEYILGGLVDEKLLDVRVFDDATKKSVYTRQTDGATAHGTSNCPLCALGHDANKSRVWKLNEMDADHVAAWSKGGATDINNCQMLCKTHNRAKGNK